MQGTAHEVLKGVRWIKADAHGAGVVNGSGVDCKGFEEALFVVSADDMGVAGTLDFKVQESSDGGVADAYADVAGAAITQKLAAGLFVGRVKCSKRERYLRGVLTIGANAVDAAVLGALSEYKYPPVSQIAATEFNI